jgi:hypothetical protein
MHVTYLAFFCFCSTTKFTLSFSFNLSHPMLTRLIEVLSIDILSNWCDLKTVANVNSAFCNDRWNFLCLLNDPTFVSTDITYPSVDAFWKWIVLNDIKVHHVKGSKSVKCVANFDSSKVSVFQMVSQQKLTRQVAKLTNQMIQLKDLTVYDYCPSLSVYTGKTTRRTSLKTFFSLVSGHILSGLTALTIVGEHRDQPDLSKVASACSQLRSLSLSKYDGEINEHTALKIIQNNKHLQRLELKGCNCKTALMRAIKEYCAKLESLVVCEFHSHGCSVESVHEMLASCKQLTNCRVNGHGGGFSVSKLNAVVTLQIEKREFMPICSVIYELHRDKLITIELCGRIEENLLVQISEGCPQLTELCVSERWYSWSVATLRSIVTRCTLLRKLQLSYVDATHDEMMGIFCSGRVLVLEWMDVLTTTPHNALSGCIAEKNSSFVYCRTD